MKNRVCDSDSQEAENKKVIVTREGFSRFLRTEVARVTEGKFLIGTLFILLAKEGQQLTRWSDQKKEPAWFSSFYGGLSQHAIKKQGFAFCVEALHVCVGRF